MEVAEPEDLARMPDYVLGLLATAENARLERLMRIDPLLQAEYHRWITHFAPLNAAYLPQRSGQSYEALELRLFGVTPRPVASRWTWRRWVFVGLMVLVVLFKIKIILLLVDVLYLHP